MGADQGLDTVAPADGGGRDRFGVFDFDRLGPDRDDLLMRGLDQEIDRPFKKEDHALGAGVDDAGFLHGRQPVSCFLEGFERPAAGIGQDLQKIFSFFLPGFEILGPPADDRNHRSLDRLGDRFVHIADRFQDGAGEAGRRNLGPVSGFGPETVKKLGENDA